MKRLCIDPGTLNTGWAEYDTDKDSARAGVWRRPKDVPPARAHEYIGQRFIDKLLTFQPDEVWVEMYFPFRGRSRKNTHAQILLVGGLLMAPLWVGAKVVSVTPKEWKDWAKPITPITENPHADDALKIGLYAQHLEDTKDDEPTTNPDG